MNRKRVRFADIPRTPSPPCTPTATNNEVNSGPSIDLSLTAPPHHAHPPPLRWDGALVVNAGADARFNVEVHVEPSIDRLLIAPQYQAHPPPLRWDVAEHPNSIKLGSRGSLRARDLSRQDVANCAVRNRANGSPMMLTRITLVFAGLPLIIEIEPTDAPVWTSTPLPYLTVGDVIYGLYKALRLSVSSREFEVLTWAHRESVSRAFHKRLASDRGNYDKNVRHGVRRIDYLGEMRQFVGLRPAAWMEVPTGKRREDVFVVVLAPIH
ncbi:hypothetical protein L226DRAFT_546934 [Lentinus tigrinus ALCF2SS1-7]|uniref:uncharacterized protein n=1 Tax=Lentinus tigrinus ALCF2SS1-7 TaxID=1328758 RepID=UPI00116607DC|nr:hypothetical protein L226DRAFT_546934 [Lentinus tigrinus ALCF2SS1-7]